MGLKIWQDRESLTV